ncbi:hypothetical protein [Lysinibacillus pakistanensis]|uniref:hypothetical protein n=1 Tax=Lysinibacillus pakistanensis TaxID=759811 RepID=UPI003D27D789
MLIQQMYMHLLNQHKASVDVADFEEELFEQAQKNQDTLLCGKIEEIKGVKFNDARILC